MPKLTKEEKAYINAVADKVVAKIKLARKKRQAVKRG